VLTTAVVKVLETVAIIAVTGLVAPSSMYQSLCLILFCVSRCKRMRCGDVQFHLAQP
jgi:hypothetical protein